jgi:hypothetical protein
MCAQDIDIVLGLVGKIYVSTKSRLVHELWTFWNCAHVVLLVEDIERSKTTCGLNLFCEHIVSSYSIYIVLIIQINVVFSPFCFPTNMGFHHMLLVFLPQIICFVLCIVTMLSNSWNKSLSGIPYIPHQYNRELS